MKTIKWLWSIAFGFLIVLFYATLTSLFVAPMSEWYLSLNKSPALPSPMVITIGWSITYIISIVILTSLIYEHKQYRGIVAMIVMGLLQVLWSILFFGAHNLLLGLIVQIVLLIVAMLSFNAVTRDKLWVSALYIIVLVWYCITTIAGYNIFMLNS